MSSQGSTTGVSLPFVLIFIALAEQSDASALATFLGEIGVAVGAGVVVGVAGGWLLVRASKAGWMGTGWSGITVIAVATIAFIAADAGGGSGFIATFVAGLTYGEVTRGRISENETLAADLGNGLVQVSFLAFGALVLEPAFGAITWQVLVMAALALTIVRIGPVALSMIGTKLGGPTILYMGWFGPRGLATIVFAALVVQEADLPGAHVDTITIAAAITVGLSVLLHGLTAYPGSQRYADWVASHKDKASAARKPVHRHRLRPRLRRTRAKEAQGS